MDNFIGTGRNPNPNVPDIPLGFGMELAQNSAAMTEFGRLSDYEKTEIIKRIQAVNTGDEAKERIAEEVNRLAGV